jgi:CBS domain-containing protein
MNSWMTPRPVVVDARQTVAMCRRLVADAAIRHLPVVEDGWLVGVLHAVTLDGAEDAAEAGDLETVSAPMVSAEAPLDEVLEALAGTSCDVVVVTEGGRPVGIFSEHDAVRIAVEQLPSAVRVDRWMTRPLSTIDASASAIEARARFGAELQRHLLAMLDGRPYGVLSWRDVQNAADLACVAECVRPVQFRVPHDAPLADAARHMANHRIGALPVMRDGEVVGIVSRSDVLAALREHHVG